MPSHIRILAHIRAVVHSRSPPFGAGRTQKRPALGDVFPSQGQAGNFRTPAVPPCLPPTKAASLRDASTSLLCNGSSPARDTAPARRFPLPSTVHLPPRSLPVSILRALWKCAVRCDLRLNSLQTFNTILPGLSRAYRPKKLGVGRCFFGTPFVLQKIFSFFCAQCSFAVSNVEILLQIKSHLALWDKIGYNRKRYAQVSAREIGGSLF